MMRCLYRIWLGLRSGRSQYDLSSHSRRISQKIERQVPGTQALGEIPDGQVMASAGA
jgi:hypothetical protein